ncbi:MAG: hypothetical protein EOP24_28050 [Hyphomicrobiales bacterium]|nr:MAG: hypothetical protein EOP24_28050 [Hyphomicrobiales bacterium]
MDATSDQGHLSRPEGLARRMRATVRRERSHPVVPLRFPTASGSWASPPIPADPGGPWRHSRSDTGQRVRAEDRVRGLKDTGIRNLRFHGSAQNQIWIEIVSPPAELLGRPQLCLDEQEPFRSWEPKRLRPRILAVAERTIDTGWKRLLRLPRGWPCTTSSIPPGPCSASPDLTDPNDHPRRTGERSASDLARPYPKTSLPAICPPAGPRDERSRLQL